MEQVNNNLETALKKILTDYLKYMMNIYQTKIEKKVISSPIEDCHFNTQILAYLIYLFILIKKIIEQKNKMNHFMLNQVNKIKYLLKNLIKLIILIG